MVILLVILVVLHGNAEKLGGKTASQYITNDKFAVLTGTMSLSNGSGSTTKSYPTGFTKDNCVAIAVGMDIMGNSNSIISYTSAVGHLFEVRLTSSNISIRCSSVDGVGSSSTKNFTVVLMKIS